VLSLFTGHASVQELVHNFFGKRIDDFAMGGTTNEGLWLKRQSVKAFVSDISSNRGLWPD